MKPWRDLEEEEIITALHDWARPGAMVGRAPGWLGVLQQHGKTAETTLQHALALIFATVQPTDLWPWVDLYREFQQLETEPDISAYLEDDELMTSEGGHPEFWEAWHAAACQLDLHIEATQKGEGLGQLYQAKLLLETVASWVRHIPFSCRSEALSKEAKDIAHTAYRVALRTLATDGIGEAKAIAEQALALGNGW